MAFGEGVKEWHSPTLSATCSLKAMAWHAVWELLPPCTFSPLRMLALAEPSMMHSGKEGVPNALKQ